MAPVLTPPEQAESTTVLPPVVRSFPESSLTCRSSTTVPPATTVPRHGHRRPSSRSAFPGFTVTVGSVEVTATPPIVAPMVVVVPPAPR